MSCTIGAGMPTWRMNFFGEDPPPNGFGDKIRFKPVQPLTLGGFAGRSRPSLSTMEAAAMLSMT